MTRSVRKTQIVTLQLRGSMWPYALTHQLTDQGSRMKVWDPIAGVLLGRARAPKPCGTLQRAGSQSRLWTDLRDR